MFDVTNHVIAVFESDDPIPPLFSGNLLVMKAGTAFPSLTVIAILNSDVELDSLWLERLPPRAKSRL